MISNQNYLSDLIMARLSAASGELRDQWNKPSGTSTRHFVVDDLLPIEVVNDIYDAYPRDGNGFFSRQTFREKKKTSADLSSYNKILSDILYAFQNVAVVDLVSTIVEMDSIEPDPMLYAGGLSMMFRGDFLNPHIDNSHDGKRERYRRLNLLYYVSPDWLLENGGNFELWDDERIVPKTIVSKANRLVVMETSKTSWHSVSKVNIDRPRCCASNYYFSPISPDTTDYFHVTSFGGRPTEPLLRFLGPIDNILRNTVASWLKMGRGKHLVNKSAEEDRD